MAQSKDQLSSLKRGLRALALLNEHRRLTGTELAQDLRIPRTTAFRVLTTLAAEGYIEQERPGHKFRLTERVRSLSAGFDEDEFIARRAGPILDVLASKVRWPLALTMPVGENMMVRTATDHTSPLALQRYYTGYTTPMLHATTGQIFLAFCTDGDRREIMRTLRESKDQRQSLAHQPTKLGRVLAQIRANGYRIIEYDIYPEGSLGVPVFSEGRIIGGLVMRYIKSALKANQLIAEFLPQLKEAAMQIEHAFAANALTKKPA
jgi:IclR family transcriptional regulator, mhp operon transcriptional activator